MRNRLLTASRVCLISRHCLLFLLLFFLFQKSNAEFVNNKRCQKIHFYVLSLRFDRAHQLIAEEEFHNPHNSMPQRFKARIAFLKAFIDDTKSSYKLFLDDNQKSLEIIKADKCKSAYKKMILSEMYLQSALLRFRFKDYISCAHDFYRSYNYIEENQKKFPLFKQNLKLLGIFNLLLGAIPEEYQWLTRGLGFKGDVNNGLRMLEKYHQASKTINSQHIESLVILAGIHQYFSSESNTAFGLVTQYKNRYQKNPLFRLVYSLSAFQAGENDSLIALLLSNRIKGGEYPFPFLDYYLLGQAKLYRLDNDADIYLKLFLQKYKGRNYIKTTWQKLAWHYFLQNNTEEYKRCINKVKTRGFANEPQDKQALKEAKRSQALHPVLLKARLLFDGGYYEKSLEVLLENAGNEHYDNTYQKIEYFYRLARVYHLLGNSKRAIKYYDIVIRSASELSYYFAPHSALLAGQLFEQQNNYTKAKAYYQKCMQINNGEYKNSIEQKARAGLNRINEK